MNKAGVSPRSLERLIPALWLICVTGLLKSLVKNLISFNQVDLHLDFISMSVLLN